MKAEEQQVTLKKGYEIRPIKLRARQAGQSDCIYVKSAVNAHKPYASNDNYKT